MPLIAHALLESFRLLEKLAEALTPFIGAIEANAARCAQYAMDSSTLATALLPSVGYDRATALVKAYQALENPPSFGNYLRQQLGDALVNEALSPQRLLCLGDARPPACIEENRA